MLNLAGQKLGKYQIIERLGHGGMAVVYKAYQPGLERLVAVKVLTGQFADIPEFVTRFKREARSIAQLRHPHIVQVFDFDWQDDQYYMVMEYIQGGTLHQRITQQGALPVHDALDIGISLSDALAYAHQRGMIHRDIKPANVMFTEGGQAVLTDFGIARIIGETTAMTSSGGFIGTPAYISPEVGRGEKVDERTDIYSMGVMLFEMVAGRMPYYGDTPYAVIMKHVHDPLPSLREFALPEAVEEVIYKALAKRVDLRYQNAAELKQALEDARAGITETQPDDSRTRILPPDSEALATPILSSSALRIPAASPQLEAEPRRRRPRGILVALGAAVTIFLAGFVALRGDYPPSVTAPPTDDNAPVLAATSTESLPTAIPTEMPTLAPTPVPTLSDSPTPFEPRVRRLFVTRAPATPTEIPSPTPVPPTRRPIVAPSSSDNGQQNNSSSSGGGQQDSGSSGGGSSSSGGDQQQTSPPPDSGPSNPVSDTVNTVGDTVDQTVDTVNDTVCSLLCP